MYLIYNDTGIVGIGLTLGTPIFQRFAFTDKINGSP